MFDVTQGLNVPDSSFSPLTWCRTKNKYLQTTNVIVIMIYSPEKMW